MSNLIEAELEPDLATILKKHPLHERVFIACAVIAILSALILLQVGLLIAGLVILSGSVLVSVLKASFPGQGRSK